MDIDEAEDLTHGHPSHNECENSDAQRAAAKCLLTFKERYKLFQAAIDFAVNSVNQIVMCVCEEVKVSIEEELESKGCDHPLFAHQ